jgi:2-polyprenyl-3-methyl-5-hydroxy-6-metoxy-1,4-benzoquinol methylase/GNAT superfamily N-acetyltransferase
MYQYDWLPGSLVQPDQLEQFSALYSEHYGIWGQNGPKPGQHVRLSPDRLRKWLTPDTSVFWASALDKLVGYAIAVRTKIPGGGVVAWVTQLVVHEDHRKQDVGKTLLFSIWRFSDFFAWALLSANPYAVRALEKATRRRCLPPRIASSVKELVHLGYAAIPYLPPDVGVVATAEEARIDTRFFLDHSQLSMMLSSVVSKGNPWSLGELPEGWEWFAFTFRDQPQISLTQREIVDMLAASDAVTREAYSRMPITSYSQAWARYAADEAGFMVENCHIRSGDRVVDFGCGPGRHSLELASLGVRVTGVDYVRSFVSDARSKAAERNLPNAEFVLGDCRTVELNATFDAAICVYDVIGSYADDLQNLAILKNLASHLRDEAFALISVMNMEYTKKNATQWFSLLSESDKLLSLKPSHTMEATGNVFDPDFYMIEGNEGGLSKGAV